MKKIFFITFCISLVNYCYSQSNEDLQNIYIKLSTAPDSSKCQIYYHLSFLYSDSSGNKAIFFAKNAVHYAQKYKDIYNQSEAWLALGSAYVSKGQWKESIDAFNVSYKLAEDKANNCQLQRIANNIGIVYKYLKEYELAIDYFNLSLKYARGCSDPYGKFSTMINIGNIYVLQEQYNKGLQIFMAAEKEYFVSDSITTEHAMIFNNIGYVNYMQSQYNSAEIYWKKSLNIYDSIKNTYGQAILTNNLAELEIKRGNFTKAEKYISSADSLQQQLCSNEARKNLYFTAYELYRDIANYEKATYYLIRYTNLKDTLYNQELNQNISKYKAEFDYYKLENESIIKDNEIERKNLLSQILFVVIVLIIIIIVLLFSFLIKSKQLNFKLKYLNAKLKVINEEIESNFQYAKLIQTAITYNNNSLSNLTLLDKPKFGVGGDFFMQRKFANEAFFILGDCTGHGTSGAILSVFAISAINKKLAPNVSPDTIVNNLNLNFLNYITESDNLKNESLTISILCLQKDKIFYAGSRQKVWHFCEATKTLTEFKTDSFLIGQEKETSFNLKSFEVHSGDVIFMASDGFADQFGDGEKGKYKYERFRQMLINWTSEGIHDTTYPEKELGSWQGKAEQTDDIMVMAIKI
jgi:serine phosphatase RsbU (regulator of sigma subunit)